ncbi:MAG: hypothetical protein ACRDI0_05330 [Actinomycetota bacterium]
MSKRRRKAGGRRWPSAHRGRPPGPHRALEDLAGKLLQDGAELATLDDPLRVEFEVSGFLALIRMVAGDDPEPVLTEVLVPRLERAGTPVARALLLAMAALSGADLARACREASDRLGRAVVPGPPWEPEVGHPRFAGAWRSTEAYGDQYGLLILLEYPPRRPHLVTAIIDHNLGGIVKDASVAEDGPGVLARWRSAPELTLTPVTAEEAGLTLLRAVQETDRTIDAPITDGSVGMRSLLAAVARRMAGVEAAPAEEPPQPMSPEERDRLAEEFLASREAGGLPPAAGEVVDTLITYRAEWAGDDPLRWSPTVVELFLLDWIPRKAILDEDALGAVPDTVRAWVRFAGQRRGLAKDLVKETAAAVDRFEAEFRRAARDETAASPAKSLVRAMQREGVDPTDRDAVARWVEDFNTRPYEERRRLTGG